MQSLFSNIYKYRESANRNSLENYSTEILAYLISKNEKFRKIVFELLDIVNQKGEEVQVFTQKGYSDFGRPDIEVNCNSFSIIFEVKVSHTERAGQLNDYAKILERKKCGLKKLVYLTSIYEYKEVEKESDVGYKNITWSDLSKVLIQCDDPISKEFYNFLHEKNMIMDSTFNSLDLVTLENVPKVILKMDQVIDSVKGYFNENIGSLSKESSRSSRLKEYAYYNNRHFGNPIFFTIDIGFQWWWHEEDKSIYLTTRVVLYKNKPETDKYKEIFDKHFLPLDWECEDEEIDFAYGKYEKVNSLITESDDQMTDMINFLTKGIDEIVKLKEIEKGIFD